MIEETRDDSHISPRMKAGFGAEQTEGVRTVPAAPTEGTGWRKH
jgi:hypothetical protein